ncbi:hypothetical protein [Oleidesulfovibrio alaskensis]|jgi:hypothetical protein|uniref:hypothetical protein n=1 Tax=Oleidesulfovibrio alaskensis TaxID=58180 RepID=UPI0003F4B17F|nr:hypothetical protein [Oleidesulfovibrio alaskensis]
MSTNCQYLTAGEDVPTRLYNVAASLRALSNLMKLEDNPLAPLMCLIGNEVEDCASWSEELLEFAEALPEEDTHSHQEEDLHIPDAAPAYAAIHTQATTCKTTAD